MTDNPQNIQEEIEDKIIDCINSGAVGRLVIFKPEKSSLKADLAVVRRGKYKEKEIYFQINSLIGPSHQENFVKDFLKEDFKADEGLYLLFVYFDDVKQKINDFIWLVPSLYFKDIVQTLKTQEGRDLLRFEAPLDSKQKNQYSKFIIYTNDLGKVIMDALRDGGKFDFEKRLKEEAELYWVVNLDNLKEFLFEARSNTYAANAVPADNPRLLASIQLDFQKADYYYRDVYFNGKKNFIGQEIIYQDLKPIWGMNYSGSQIGKLETAFLRESLLKLVKKCRLGELCEYEKREFKYQNSGQGSMEDFFGEEEIFLEGKSIYKLNYRGGLL